MKRIVLYALCMVFAFTGCENSDKKVTTFSGVDGNSAVVNDDNGSEKSNGGSADGITMDFDDSGLSNDNVVYVGDGEFDYYKYDQAALGNVKVTLSDLPKSVSDIKKMKLPTGMSDIHDIPYFGPALLVAALLERDADKEESKRMINYVARSAFDSNQGAADAYASDWSQINQYSDLSAVATYFEGANKGNDYTPSSPITMNMELTNYSYTADKDYIRLQIKSSQKSSPQFIMIKMEDKDGDGNYDFFYPTEFMTLAHSLGVYK